ncbi:MAG: DUF2085 domain-containing protein [Candidatus Micrarchaeota archaeon]
MKTDKKTARKNSPTMNASEGVEKELQQSFEVESETSQFKATDNSNLLWKVPYFLYTFVLLAFVLSLFVIPYLEATQGTEKTGGLLFHLFRPMCHQLPQRSFFVFGAQMPVCARDIGIYGGMLLGAIAFPFVFRMKSTKVLPIWIFIAAMVPIGLDGGTQLVSEYFPLPLIGVYESTNPVRLATGLLMGIVMSLYAIPLLNGVWHGYMEERKESRK